jgi:phosphoribosylformylglycinamidine synthase
VAGVHSGQGGLSDLELLYAESAGRLLVCVAPKDRPAFAALFSGQACGCLGAVTANPVTHVRRGETTLVHEDVEALARAFAATLAW